MKRQNKKEKLREKIYDIIYDPDIHDSELYDKLIKLLDDSGVHLDKLV